MEIIIEDIKRTIKQDGTVFVIGNGGSCSQASHFVSELIGRFENKRKPIKANALNNSSVITCIGNDYGFDNIYSRQLEALATDRDLLIALSTSGESDNIFKAILQARLKKCKTVLITGKKLNCKGSIADYVLNLDSEKTYEIQELTLRTIHQICKELEVM